MRSIRTYFRQVRAEARCQRADVRIEKLQATAAEARQVQIRAGWLLSEARNERRRAYYAAAAANGQPWGHREMAERLLAQLLDDSEGQR